MKIIAMIMIIISTLVTIDCVQQEPGFIEGRVTIGPLCPVEPCNVNPEQLEKMYETRKISIYSEDKILVKEVKLNKIGYYKVELNPGSYIVDMDNVNGGFGIGGSNLPKDVKVESGDTIKLDINIDTGIR